MATTQESYKQKGRLPRYTTKLNAFANGMYLTNQIIPEGFVKTMVNYDIDDTGTHIKPRRGRELVQTIAYPNAQLGPVTLTDYIYAYNKDNIEVESIQDIVTSYGQYTSLSDVVEVDGFVETKPIYLCKMNVTEDTNHYTQTTDDEGNVTNTIIAEGEVTDYTVDNFWMLRYIKDIEEFEKVENLDIGFLTARTIDNAYAFTKAFKNKVGRPIGTVVNNELFAFTGSMPNYQKFKHNPELNTIANYSDVALSKILVTNEGQNYTVKRSIITPRVLNAAEATATGFNIFSSEPYQFENEIGGALSILGAVMYQVDDLTKPVFSPKITETVKVHVTYQYPEGTDTIKVKVEYLDLSRVDPDGIIEDTDWVVLEDWTKSFKAGDNFYYEYTPTLANTALRFTLRIGDDDATQIPYWIRVRCDQTSYTGVEAKKFDLSTCKGMTNWQGCVGVYGVDTAPETIFFSDVGDPSYFPFPYNVITFDNEILAVHNYLDYLMVITVDSIWLVSPGTTIATSIQKRILANIHIPEIDAINLVVLKDQIFFKTDTQFYVLKPNKYTSDATDLKNYTNSTALANYTADFQVVTVDLLNKVYKTVWQEYTKQNREQIRFDDFDVLDTRSVVRDEEVHYIYTIVPKLSNGEVLENLNLHLVYNTMTRSWRLFFKAIGADDTAHKPVLYRNKQSGIFYEFFAQHAEEGSQLHIAMQTYNTVSDNLSYNNWQLVQHFDNFGYLDTGNASIDDTFTKRYREVQFNLLNLEPTQIDFYVDFKVDGQEHIAATTYRVQHITDATDPDYGKIFITPLEASNMFLEGATTLSSAELESDHWALDLSQFPELDVATVRFNLQGRGRRGSLQLLNTSLKKYQLSDINWVYRIMSAR